MRVLILSKFIDIQVEQIKMLILNDYFPWTVMGWE